MDFRYLGSSGMQISTITYGNWLTHGSQVENDVATENVKAAGVVLPPEVMTRIDEALGDIVTRDASLVARSTPRQRAI